MSLQNLGSPAASSICLQHSLSFKLVPHNPIMGSSMPGAKPIPSHDPVPVKPTGTPSEPEGPPFDPGKWPKH